MNTHCLVFDEKSKRQNNCFSFLANSSTNVFCKILVECLQSSTTYARHKRFSLSVWNRAYNNVYLIDMCLIIK